MPSWGRGNFGLAGKTSREGAGLTARGEASYFFAPPHGFFGAQGFVAGPPIGVGLTFMIVPLPKT